MALLGKIVEISTLSGTPYTYVLLHLWPNRKSYDAGDEPSGDNQFIMDLYKTREQRITDSQGRHKTLEGKFVHPDRATGNEDWETAISHVDIAAKIEANVRAYMAERVKLAKTKDAYPVFHAQPAMVRTRDDPRGILARSDVQNLVTKVVTE